MRRPAFHTIVIVLLLGAFCTDLAAWAPETRIRMVRDALNMMPRSLRSVLGGHEKSIMRGALTPLTEEGTPPHLPPALQGTLPDEISRRSAALVAAVDEREPFSEIAERFGALSHFVADAGYPPSGGGAEGAIRYDHFAGFVNSRLEKIPFVFYGHDRGALQEDEIREFALGIIERAARQDSELARSYGPDGADGTPGAFDDRSVPFAIASLAYSRTVTDIVRAWLSAWERARGDLGRTPYLDRNRIKRRR